MEADKTDEGNVLFRFLLELALGQWNAVPNGYGMPDGENKTLQLAGLLSEELRALILHKALVNPGKRFHFIRQGLFILDEHFKIRAMGSDTASFLGLSEARLYKSDFTGYLLPESQKTFFIAASSVRNGNPIRPILQQLQFVDANGATITADCSIDLLLYGNYSLVISLFSLSGVVLHDGKSPAPLPDKNLVAVQKVHDFIRTHKEGALPSAHAFARRFGTNEYELKKEFRKRFGTSIYQLYTRVRLERAHELICGTEMPLSEVALQSGFDDYSSFARAYRKHYGESPAKSKPQQ